MPNIIHKAHDKYLKKLMAHKQVARDFLKNHLPIPILKKIDLSTLKATSETAIDDNWQELRNDVVFNCKTKKGQDAYIYVLIEHQSTPDIFMPLRLLRYKMNILGKYLDTKKRPKKIPNIVSIVIYHGKETYVYPKDIFSCFNDEKLAFDDITKPMNLLDLSSISKDKILELGGADAALKLFLKFARDIDFIKKVEKCMLESPNIFVSLSEQQAKLLFEYVIFVGKGNKENAENMEQAIRKIYGQEKAKKIFSLADYFKQQGIQEGIQKGIKKGEEAIHKLLKKGIITKAQAEKEITTLKKL